jgi:translocation and assembly module TamB
MSSPIVSGVVSPQESIFITDVKTLIPTGPSSPDVKPPFFRVDHPLLGEWRLDIRVQGDRFLRIRTPVFLGMASVSMTLRGVLKEPVLLGDIILAEGTIQFPFGNLDVTQGLVSLSQSDPTQPDVFVSAGSRVYGYQIAMEVSGKADNPEVLLSSNPPLGSEDILLMLTAGKLPQDELTFSNQQKATKLASYLGKSFLDSWSLKEPSEGRLTMRSGESVSVGGRITYSLDYLLVDRWSLTGEYDEYDAINAGVKFKVFER